MKRTNKKPQMKKEFAKYENPVFIAHSLEFTPMEVVSFMVDYKQTDKELSWFKWRLRDFYRKKLKIEEGLFSNSLVVLLMETFDNFFLPIIEEVQEDVFKVIDENPFNYAIYDSYVEYRWDIYEHLGDTFDYLWWFELPECKVC
jgi:hypothetical protein